MTTGKTELGTRAENWKGHPMGTDWGECGLASKALMDWMDANGVQLLGATPSMLVSVLHSAGHIKTEAQRTGDRQ